MSILATKCTFCDLSFPHACSYTTLIRHYKGFPCFHTVVRDHPLDPRDLSRGLDFAVPDAANLPFRFELQVEDGTRFPVLMETLIHKPCTLVVVKDGDVYGAHRVSLLPGDNVSFSSDEDNRYGSLIGSPMPDTPEGKSISVYYGTDSNTGVVHYWIGIYPGGKFSGATETRAC
jgi:hypothetical protein